jgi:Zn-dependent protease
MKRQHIIVVVIAAVIAVIAWQEGVITAERLIFIGILGVSIILHEVSHGWAALGFGDETAKEAGRLTLNPLAHIDPFGTLILPAILIFTTGVGFGYAKPVPVNPRRMRDPRNHSLLVALAGPATNIVLVGIATVAIRMRDPGTSSFVLDLLFGFGLLNVALAVFNLIPIPPLDGSAVIERVLPRQWWPGYIRLRQYSMLILLALVFLVPGGFSRIIRPAVDLWVSFL